jgi:hypothetical protein
VWSGRKVRFLPPIAPNFDGYEVAREMARREKIAATSRLLGFRVAPLPRRSGPRISDGAGTNPQKTTASSPLSRKIFEAVRVRRTAVSI